MPHFLIAALLIAVVSCCSITSVHAADLSAQGKAEISYLLTYLKNSGCQFNRNGKWYSADEAVAHLDTKYDYLLKKNMLASAEDFIDKAAAKSSMSGKPYLVQCGSEAPAPSSAWFRAELAQYRSGKR
jgi:hypothetical protein